MEGNETATEDAQSVLSESQVNIKPRTHISEFEYEPRIAWIIERIEIFYQLDSRDAIHRMLKRHNYRALKKLCKILNERGDLRRNTGFLVYGTFYKKRHRKTKKIYKIHLKEGEEQQYSCSVEKEFEYSYTYELQLHMHFDLHFWKRFPSDDKLVYFITRQESFPCFETILEARARMPAFFYIGQIGLRHPRTFKTFWSVFQLYFQQVFINPNYPNLSKSGASGKSSHREIRNPSIFEAETSASYLKKWEEIEKLLKSEGVPLLPTFSLEGIEQGIENIKLVDKSKVIIVDDFYNSDLIKLPKVRNAWFKRKKPPVSQFNERVKTALTDTPFPKSNIIESFQRVTEVFDSGISKITQCTFNILYSDFLAKLDLKKFDDDPELRKTHMNFLTGILEIWNLHIKNLLRLCESTHIQGKDVLSLYDFYKDRRDKLSNLVFEMFHPLVENLLYFVKSWSPSVVSECKRIRSQLENYYIICWDTCDYMELCLNELKTIHTNKTLRPIMPCVYRILEVVKMMLTLSFYWKSNNRFLDILNRLHYIIQTKIEKTLNTQYLFQLPNRLGVVLCEDVIFVSQFWQNTVEQDRAFSQKINFEKFVHMREVAQSILYILNIMKSYNHVFCNDCYDAENENYKLDAVAYEVNQLTLPLVSTDINYLEVENKTQWVELVDDFKARCATFDKQASLLILDAINKAKSTRTVAAILVHFKTSTKLHKMDSLFQDIFKHVDISPQFIQEIREILEIFLKASHNKDSMRSFGLASKSIQWTRCLFYVVQKNLKILFSIGSVLNNVYEKVIINYLRCVDMFTSYEVGLYKVWLKRYVDYVRKVVTKHLVKLDYDRGVLEDDDSTDLLGGINDSENRGNMLSYKFKKNLKRSKKKHQLSQFSKFSTFFQENLPENQFEKLTSLHSIYSPDDLKNTSSGDNEYKKTLLVKFGIDLDNWYTERHMINYNFMTRLALGMCTQDDEQLEANVYFLLEKTLKQLILANSRAQAKQTYNKLFEMCDYFKTYDCSSSSGSITKISELLTENSESVELNENEVEVEANNFLVDRNPAVVHKLTDVSYLDEKKMPLFLAIRENFRERVNNVLGGDPVEIVRKFQDKTKQVLSVDPDSECSEECTLPSYPSVLDRPSVVSQDKEREEIEKYKVLFKTDTSNLHKYEELAFVLWLNNTKMKFVDTPEDEDGDPGRPPMFSIKPDLENPCNCGLMSTANADRCRGCSIDWLDQPHEPEPSYHLSRPNSSLDASSVQIRGKSVNDMGKRKHSRYNRTRIEKYECPANDIFVEEDEADPEFRKKFNVYVAKLIADCNQQSELISPNEISSRIRGFKHVNDPEHMYYIEVTDDDMPEQKISNETSHIMRIQRKMPKLNKKLVKSMFEESMRQAEGGSSENEKNMKAVDFEQEIRKTIPGIYTGCKHSLKRINWDDFVGNDILKEHGYTISAVKEPFTYVACRDIETFEEFGFLLPPELTAFAYNNFDRNKHEIQDIVSLYNDIIANFPLAKIMALKKYIRPVETKIGHNLYHCGLRTLNITKQCHELVVQLNKIAITEILMSEIEYSLNDTLSTISRLNFYKLPSHRAYSVKQFFFISNNSFVKTQNHLWKLYKLIPEKLLKLETLLFKSRTGKCEYLIAYYRCTEKKLFRRCIEMMKTNLTIFQKFVLGESKSRFFLNTSLSEPLIHASPDLKYINTLLRGMAEKVVHFLLTMPRWFDGTCSKVPCIKKKWKNKNVHSYSFGEDLLGSEMVVEELQRSYECISYVIDAVDDYIRQWTKFEHLWVEDIEDVFMKFALGNPSIQDYYDIFNFYHKTIVEIFKMPDFVDIYCMRIKITDIKKKTLIYALAWRNMAKVTVMETIRAESHDLFLKMQKSFANMGEIVTSYESLRNVLKAAYLFGELEQQVSIGLSSISTKTSLLKMWVPKNLYHDSETKMTISHNLKQLKCMALYRSALLSPYLSKLAPRRECIHCSTPAIINNFTVQQSESSKFINQILKEPVPGSSVTTTLLALIEELESLVQSGCDWDVVTTVLDNLQSCHKFIKALKVIHPKISMSSLSTGKQIQQLLNVTVPKKEEKDKSVELLIKSIMKS